MTRHREKPFGSFTFFTRNKKRFKVSQMYMIFITKAEEENCLYIFVVVWNFSSTFLSHGFKAK